MDNRIFNVNGRGNDMLLATLKLVFSQEGTKTKAAGYIMDSKKGMILLWNADDENATKFPVPLDAAAIALMIFSWLDSKPEVECKNFDANPQDSDVSTSLGWRVFCEDWGHVAGNHYAICAIKPAFMWYGK